MELDRQNFVPEKAPAKPLQLSEARNEGYEGALSIVNAKPLEDQRDEVIVYLQQDNVRLEQELRLAHDQLEYYSGELSCKAKSQQLLENKLKNAIQQNNNLLAELARFEAARALIENQSDDARRVVALQERLSELEQSSREMREQLFDELRIAETKLSMAEDTIRSSQERILELERSSDDWRRRFEEIAQENEALARANGEVRNLEAAIGEVKEEKHLLYQKLNELLDEKRQLLAARDHLSNRIDDADSQNSKLQAKIRQLNESFNKNVMKLVEKENCVKELNSRVNKLTEEVTTERRTNAQLREQSKWLKKQVSNISTQRSLVTEGSLVNEQCLSTVTISADDLKPEIDLSRCSKNIYSPGDMCKDKVEPSHIILGNDRNANSLSRHTSIFPNVLRFRRFLHLLPHRRRSMKVYLRCAFVVYIVLIHIFLFRYLIS